MSDDDTTTERTFASVDDAVAEKRRLAALSGGRVWRIAGPFATLNEPIDFANQPPAAQAGEFSVVFAANAFFAIWLQ
jgi:hypothetical protein